VKIQTELGTPHTPVPAAGAAGSDGHTRRAIVRLLLESGSITASEIGDQLGLSAAGVRRHLDALIEAGDAESVAAAPWQQAGRGRPAKRYRLTGAGRGKLDHSYDDLASAAMRQLREIGGDDAVKMFARRRIDAILADVVSADGPDEAALEAAAGRIASALSKAGYVATTTRVGGPIHGVQICQHHCPVAHVAEEFPELCEAEQQAMSEVLGTHVQLLATIVNGDCACTTHVPLAVPDSVPTSRGAQPAPSPRPVPMSTKGASL
jgi:predicted ArsR family transcriptional regulator